MPWSLTTTTPGRINTTVVVADDHDAAVTAALAAAQAAIHEARVIAAPATLRQKCWLVCWLKLLVILTNADQRFLVERPGIEPGPKFALSWDYSGIDDAKRRESTRNDLRIRQRCDGINTLGARLSAYWGVGSSVIQSLSSNAVPFLVSDESRYVTGLEFKVDAGVSIS